MVKVAVAQISLTLGDVHANTNKLLEKIADASLKDVDVIVFPEMSDTGYYYSTMINAAQDWDRGTVPALCKAAEAYTINVIAGVSERCGETVYNSIVVMNRAGEITAKYRKTHLCTAEPFLEHKLFGAGNELVQVEINGMMSGFMNCYEIRFPEIARTLALKGVKIIFVVSAFPMVRLQHWKTLLEARAVENQIYIVACNRVGTDNNNVFAGTSLIIDPYGTIVSSASAIHEGLIIADIDMDMVETVRSQIKVHQDRQPSLYSL